MTARHIPTRRSRGQNGKPPDIVSFPDTVSKEKPANWRVSQEFPKARNLRLVPRGASKSQQWRGFPRLVLKVLPKVIPSRARRAGLVRAHTGAMWAGWAARVGSCPQVRAQERRSSIATQFRPPLPQVRQRPRFALGSLGAGGTSAVPLATALTRHAQGLARLAVTSATRATDNAVVSLHQAGAVPQPPLQIFAGAFGLQWQARTGRVFRARAYWSHNSGRVFCARV